MYLRTAQTTVKRLAKGFPVVVITGPRQSGKTTLTKLTFPDKPYISLEDPDILAIAESDPRRFLENYADGAIFDEAQRAPKLFSYLQTIVDQNHKPGRYIITGSQQFGLLSGITQSLAGRAGLVQLLPFSVNELQQAKKLPKTTDELLIKGYYPPLHHRSIDHKDWFANYLVTYIERDVRQLINVQDLSMFRRFVKMCAARTGQLLNLSTLAGDCGISHNTAAAWLSALEASYLVYLLHPHYENFNKRLVKTPKLYFYDVGLASYLLGIHSSKAVTFHAMRGRLFETMIIGEFLKFFLNQGREAPVYFWRDNKGIEVDLLLEKDNTLVPVEIKSGATIASDYTDSLQKWMDFSKTKAPAWLFYDGSQHLAKGQIKIIPWQSGLTELTNG